MHVSFNTHEKLNDQSKDLSQVHTLVLRVDLHSWCTHNHRCLYVVCDYTKVVTLVGHILFLFDKRLASM